MIADIASQIKELEWELNRLITAEKRLYVIELEINSLSKKVYEKSLQVDKELLDIEKFEKMSFYLLFATILKDKEAQIEKERQEYLMVVLDYQASAKELDLLIYEQKIILEKLQKKDEVNEKLKDLLKQKELYLMKDLGMLLPKVLNLNKTIDNLNINLYDIDDNKQLCALCIVNLIELSDKMDQTNIWGFSDQYNRSTKSSYKTIQLMKEIPDLITNFKIRINNLNNELSSLNPSLIIKPEFRDFENLVNNYQKIMLDDWLAQSKLAKIKSNLLKLGVMLNNLLKELEMQKQSIIERIEVFEDEKRRIIAVLKVD